jgi:UDP-N-acetyl-D-glucosamine dehydrogenase
MKEMTGSLVIKLESKSAKIGIIGLGYVGLPLAIAFAKKFNVIGYDVNESIIKNLLTGRSFILDVGENDIREHLNKTFFPTHNHKELEKCDFIIICVPTPLTEERIPDLSYIIGACKIIAMILREGQFVILESTTYPRTTEEILIPLLEREGLKAGVDFGVAYSPERIDPGNRKYKIGNIPKVVGGINEGCTEIAAVLYESITEKVIKVGDTKTAEAVKMVENIFRNVNIALVNELALIFERLDINIWAVIDAAATKPYGFMPFYPGPGIGGHCIPLDPFYMSYIAKRYEFIPRFIETAGEINEFMKIHVVNLAEKGLKKAGKSVHEAKVVIMGLAYKKNIDDTRESPAIDIIEELVNLGAEVRVYDPYVKSIRTKVGVFYSEKVIEDAFKDSDCAIFVVDHDVFKEISAEQLRELMKSPVIIDCKNVFISIDNREIIYFGIGKDNPF